MAKVAVGNVGIYEGPSYMENTEDGSAAVFDCYAAVTTTDGRDFCHLVPFRSKRDERLARLVARVEAAAEIDTDHWALLPPPSSLEDRFAMYAMQEEEVRRGLRSEDELYDGIPYR